MTNKKLPLKSFSEQSATRNTPSDYSLKVIRQFARSFHAELSIKELLVSTILN